MSGTRIPDEPPPSYSQATGSSSQPGPSAGSDNRNDNAHLDVPGSSIGGNNGVPSAYRRSMEDEMRPLPDGWVRTFDPNTKHQFFVDTTKEPPRSIWHHPHDDEEYLATLSGAERERIEQDAMNRGKHHPSHDDIIRSHSDDEGDGHQHSSTAAGGASSSPSSYSELPPRPDGKGKQPDGRSFGRKWKDKVTGTTHEQRVEERNKRAEEEQRAYEQHMRFRQAMTRAMETGQPQYLGKDKDGKDVYVEPPPPPPPQPAGFGGFGGFGGNAYGYSPYQGQQYPTNAYQSGPYQGNVYQGNPYPGNTYQGDPYQPGVYSTPDARYIRPAAPYGRPPGSGFGGGYGLPLALGLGGGLLGGMLLGDAFLF